MSEQTTIKQLIEDNFNWDERTDLDEVLATIKQLLLDAVIGSNLPMDSAMNAAVNGTKEYQRQALEKAMGGK